MIKAVLFDFIGTTVKEAHPEVINNCFEKAFTDNNVPVDISLLKKERGKDKKVIIENVLQSLQLPLSLVQDIYASFKGNVEINIHEFYENDGASVIFSYLREKNIKVCIGTGLERTVFSKIFNHLKWDSSYFDYIGIAGETGRSRPHPDMIFDMIDKLGIPDKNAILKVGDTLADIREGKNAKVRTAVILSGTQPRDILLEAKPDFVVTSLSGIKEIVEEKQPAIRAKL
ncbi:MAG: HAD-IA family hydrolase [Bacteroidota bacterium]|nr:HAD-IA family hydrolase [Bacteroidota bacterium]